MKTLNVDIESFCEVNISKHGMYKYARHRSFEVMLFGFSRDRGLRECTDLVALEEIPPDVVKALWDPEVIKYAYNAPFEIETLGQHFGKPLIASQWRDTMVLGAMCGLPLGLAQIGDVLRLGVQKDMMGAQLIRYFCIPCKPTKANGGRTRNMPWHAPEKWEEFKKYNIRDVDVEIAVGEKLAFYEIPEQELRLWELDHRINSHGVMVDQEFIAKAMKGDAAFRERALAEAVELTGLSNPNSNKQLKEWLELEINDEVTTLKKDAIPDLIKGTDDIVVKRVLEIRQSISRTSIKKYQAMVNTACDDDYVRGMFQFCGANRTWRWAGRGVQFQNLPRSEIKDLGLARELVLQEDFDMIDLLYGSVPDTLSQLVRTAFIAPPGKKFLVCDFSAIEARVIAWLAGEKWRLDVFKTHGKIYEASAAAMFKIPIESIDKDSPYRQKGKVAELALGFGGSVGALVKMGALEKGLVEDELKGLVDLWRAASPAIVNLWDVVGDAALGAMERGSSKVKCLRFEKKKGVLFMHLPSGHSLGYVHPEIRPNKWGYPGLTYMGMNQTSKKWERIETFAGKLVENAVQAIARDILADAMLRLDGCGYKIVAHAHDEVVMEVEEDATFVDLVEGIMSREIPWCVGLPLGAKGFESKFYRK
jgi:DNA polymerase